VYRLLDVVESLDIRSVSHSIHAKDARGTRPYNPRMMLALCDRAGLLKLEHVSLDGSKVKANASKHKAMSHGRDLRGFGPLCSGLPTERSVLLRRAHRIRTVHASVAVEGNTLTLDQVEAVAEASIEATDPLRTGARSRAQSDRVIAALESEDMRSEITARFGYDLNRTVAEIRPDYSFNETSQATPASQVWKCLRGTYLQANS